MKKLYPEEDVQNIADAIRAKNGETSLYRIGEMASAIDAIPTGSGVGNIGEIIGAFNPVDSTANYSPLKGRVLETVTAYRLRVTLMGNDGTFLQAKNIPWNASSWECGFAIYLPTDTSPYPQVLCSAGAHNYFNCMPLLQINGTDRSLSFGYSTAGYDGNSWDEWVDTGLTIPSQRWAFIKFGWDALTKTFTVEVTTDFSTWATYEKTISGNLHQTTNNSRPIIFFGHLESTPPVNETTWNAYGVKIDLANSYLKLNDAIIWGAFAQSFIS